MMRKRVSIFAGLVALLVGAVGFAAVGTGAYFTDSESGNYDTTIGHVQIGQPVQGMVSFQNLLPGTDQDVTQSVAIDSTDPAGVDVYVKLTKAGLQGCSCTYKANGQALAENGTYVKLADDWTSPTFNLTLTASLPASATTQGPITGGQGTYTFLIQQHNAPAPA